MFDDDAMNATTLRHALNPKVGDFWHEMFYPIAVVLKVETSVLFQDRITICEKTKSVGGERWTWDLKKTTQYTGQEFANRFRYGRVGNPDFQATDDDNIKNKFWCNVSPEAHTWVKDHLNGKGADEPAQTKEPAP